MKAFVGIGGVLVLALLAAVSQRPAMMPLMRVSASGPPWTITDLWNKADYVLVVRPSGPQVERWNNAANTLWEAPEDSGVMPMVVRDEEVDVLQVLKGSAPESMTIRNIGGVADGVRFEYEGLFDLATGQRYLVFLYTALWPTQDGTEEATGFVGTSHGLWVADGGGFHNGFGLTVTEAEVQAWARGGP